MALASYATPRIPPTLVVCSTLAPHTPHTFLFYLQVALDLRQRILDLYERHLSADGRAVSYKSVGQDPLLKK